MEHSADVCSVLVQVYPVLWPWPAGAFCETATFTLWSCSSHSAAKHSDVDLLCHGRGLRGVTSNHCWRASNFCYGCDSQLPSKCLLCGFAALSRTMLLGHFGRAIRWLGQYMPPHFPLVFISGCCEQNISSQALVLLYWLRSRA